MKKGFIVLLSIYLTLRSDVTGDKTVENLNLTLRAEFHEKIYQANREVALEMRKYLKNIEEGVKCIYTTLAERNKRMAEKFLEFEKAENVQKVNNETGKH
jgi:hypothetical protein